MDTTSVYSIGHSNHSIEAFVGLLQRHGVTALADVRSSPWSRFHPQFNREALARSLKDAGIQYVFLGRELGARSDDPSCYRNGRVQYALLARTELFRQGIERVRQGAQRYRIALMCAEKEPLECHRTLLVSRALVEDAGIPVAHIHADGHLEPHEAAMQRLPELVGLPREDLFRSPEELRAEALQRQEARIAYVDEQPASDAATV